LSKLSNFKIAVLALGLSACTPEDIPKEPLPSKFDYQKIAEVDEFLQDLLWNLGRFPDPRTTQKGGYDFTGDGIKDALIATSEGEVQLYAGNAFSNLPGLNPMALEVLIARIEPDPTGRGILLKILPRPGNYPDIIAKYPDGKMILYSNKFDGFRIPTSDALPSARIL